MSRETRDWPQLAQRGLAQHVSGQSQGQHCAEAVAVAAEAPAAWDAGAVAGALPESCQESRHMEQHADAAEGSEADSESLQAPIQHSFQGHPDFGKHMHTPRHERRRNALPTVILLAKVTRICDGRAHHKKHRSRELTQVVLLSRPLAVQALWLRQGEALRCRAPGAQPGPRLLGRLLGRRPALLQPRLQAGHAGGCIAHALPALLKSPLEARILHNSREPVRTSTPCVCLPETSTACIPDWQAPVQTFTTSLQWQAGHHATDVIIVTYPFSYVEN